MHAKMYAKSITRTIAIQNSNNVKLFLKFDVRQHSVKKQFHEETDLMALGTALRVRENRDRCPALQGRKSGARGAGDEDPGELPREAGAQVRDLCRACASHDLDCSLFKLSTRLRIRCKCISIFCFTDKITETLKSTKNSISYRKIERFIDLSYFLVIFRFL